MKEVKCFLGSENSDAICVNKADYIRTRKEIERLKRQIKLNREITDEAHLGKNKIIKELLAEKKEIFKGIGQILRKEITYLKEHLKRADEEIKIDKEKLNSWIFQTKRIIEQVDEFKARNMK